MSDLHPGSVANIVASQQAGLQFESPGPFCILLRDRWKGKLDVNGCYLQLIQGLPLLLPKGQQFFSEGGEDGESAESPA